MKTRTSAFLRTMLLQKILLTTLVAVVIAFFAIGTISVSGIHTTGVTDAEIIRQHNPIRLVRPEWVSNKPDILFDWIVAESIARESLVTALWLGALSFVIFRHFRLRKGRPTGRLVG